MFNRKSSSKMPIKFYVNGVNNSSSYTHIEQSPTTSLPIIKRFTMFQNIQNAKPCGSCGGK